VARREISWRDRYGEEVTCVRCLEVRDTVEVDRLLWCETCRERARARAARQGWLVGLAGAALLAAWIWIVVEPSDLVLGGWIGTVVAAAWIGSKVAREILYGVERFRNRRAADAAPPQDRLGPEPPVDEGGGSGPTPSDG
jgi:hypothetical protein